MSVLKKTLFKVLAAVGCLSTSFVGAMDLCDCGFVVGGDFLYWSPCISNMHFAAQGLDNLAEPQNEVSYHFINTDWDSGFRVYLGKEDLFGCFDVLATYTCFDAKHTDEEYDETGRLTLTWPTPVGIENNLYKYATAEWKIDFQRIELIAGYTIEFGKGCCLALKPFAGVDYASINQDRIDNLMDEVPVVNEKEPEKNVIPGIINTLTRSLDYQGIGPMVGMGYHFEICDGLATFGRASLSLLVGKVDIKDLQALVNNPISEDDFTNIQRYEDKCVCLPNLHLQTGLSYSACVCNKWLTFRIGYEYLQYVNAPSHLMYHTDSQGSFTGLNHNSVTLQGFFGGVAFAF